MEFNSSGHPCSFLLTQSIKIVDKNSNKLLEINWKEEIQYQQRHCNNIAPTDKNTDDQLNLEQQHETSKY